MLSLIKDFKPEFGPTREEKSETQPDPNPIQIRAHENQAQADTDDKINFSFLKCTQENYHSQTQLINFERSFS